MLEIRNITKQYGGNNALDGCSLSIDAGDSVGLIGPNGAGKTTLLDIVSGLTEPDAGTVRFRDRPLGSQGVVDRARSGIGRTFQVTRVLETMTVEENLLAAVPDLEGQRPWRGLLSSIRGGRSDAVQERADAVLRSLELTQHRDTYAGSLSGGQKKLLELGRCLMTDPDLLLLDEPLSGVTPALADRLIERLGSLHDDGVTLLAVGHRLGQMDRFVDEVAVMMDGMVITRGSMTDVQQDDRVRSAYLGGDTDA